MRCHDQYSTDTTEECIMNDSILPGWRRFRIEYGFECSCPEGVIYIKDGLDIYDRLDKICELLGDPRVYIPYERHPDTCRCEDCRAMGA